MNLVTNVGQLRAILGDLPDDVIIAPAKFSWVGPDPGVYVLRYVPGTYSPAAVEVFIQPDWLSGVTAVGSTNG